jgi:hypothetical protein
MEFVAQSSRFDAAGSASALPTNVLRLERGRWSPERARRWYDQQPWFVGANYVPAYAINQIEMWQAETFDPVAIARELDWARDLGMNSMRVFLHDLLWREDPAGFQSRIDQYLDIAAERGIRSMIVLFDSVWHPEPRLGPQTAPIRGVHNSGWVQSPHRDTLENPAEWPWLRDYVDGVVSAFGRDDRIAIWDVWNEPDNIYMGTLKDLQSPRKFELVAELLPQVFSWVRAADPMQPLTSAVWHNHDWRWGPKLNAIEQTQLGESDIISFHNYEWPEKFEARIGQLSEYGRPIVCTEWLARSVGSLVETVLPVAHQHRVGMYNWGLVAGRSQTVFHWDSWRTPWVPETADEEHPPVWFHDLLRPDGTPYRAAEANMFRMLANQPAAQIAARA